MGRRWKGAAAVVAVVVAGAACTGTPSRQDAGGPAGTAVESLPASVIAAPDAVAALPGAPPVTTAQFAGYASVTDLPCATVRCDGPGEVGLFSWFVGQGPDPGAAPTILWTNGGPGSTSFWGFFTENGPYQVSPDLTVSERTTGWQSRANYLIFDHPLGVGLSFADDADLPGDVRDGVDQWYRALVHWLGRHPDVAAKPIVLAGESYGGTYVPLLARAILDGNARAGREVVRLGGIVLSAPWTVPVVGQSMDTTYALGRGLITESDKERLDDLYERCRQAVESATPSSKEADDACSQVKAEIARISGRYLLNLSQTGDPPTDQVAAYLNRPDVRAALHAPADGTFAFFDERIGDRYTIGEQDSHLDSVQAVLDSGVPILVISGLEDATDVNFLGVGRWLAMLTGPDAQAFQAAPTTQWKDGGEEVLGYLQQGGGLTWVKVLGAGHLAVGDQPRLINLIDQVLLTGPAG